MTERLAAMLLVASLAATSGANNAVSQAAPTTIGGGGIATDIVKAGHPCSGGVNMQVLPGPEARSLEAKGLRPMLAQCDSGELYQIVYGQRGVSGGVAVQSIKPMK